MVAAEPSMEARSFVPIDIVARQLGCSVATINRRIRFHGRQVFVDPRDHRRRLIRAEDVAWLKMPQPISALEEAPPQEAA